MGSTYTTKVSDRGAEYLAVLSFNAELTGNFLGFCTGQKHDPLKTLIALHKSQFIDQEMKLTEQGFHALWTTTRRRALLQRIKDHGTHARSQDLRPKYWPWEAVRLAFKRYIDELE